MELESYNTTDISIFQDDLGYDQRDVANILKRFFNWSIC